MRTQFHHAGLVIILPLDHERGRIDDDVTQARVHAGRAVQDQHAGLGSDGHADFIGDFQAAGAGEMHLVQELLDQLPQLLAQGPGQLAVNLDIALQQAHPFLRERCSQRPLQAPARYPGGQGDRRDTQDEQQPGIHAISMPARG